jgi:chromosome partitioning protein
MRTIAIVNQKGGCGKTTTAINLSACLALNNKRVLLIDLDPQSHTSIGLGVKVEELEKSIYDVFSESNRKSLDDVIIEIDQNFDLAPSQLILSAVEQELAGTAGRESVLARSFQNIESHYDYIIVDCPPSLGLLTFNTLKACSEALIPIEMSAFSLQGVARLLETIEILKEKYGHIVKPKALATMCNPRTLFANEVLKNIEEHFEKDMYKTIIHDTVRLKEAAGFGIPIHKYNKRCRGAEDYMGLTGEVLAEEKRIGKIKIPVQIGPKQTKEGVIFSYYDPVAQNVQLVGDFSDWKPVDDILTQEEGNNIWRGTFPLDPGKYQYKFVVDGEWKIDPNNPEVAINDQGANNSLVIVS